MKDWSADPHSGNDPMDGWSAVLLGSGYGDTTQIRHSMPREAAKAGSSCSYVGQPQAKGVVETQDERSFSNVFRNAQV